MNRGDIASRASIAGNSIAMASGMNGIKTMTITSTVAYFARFIVYLVWVKLFIYFDVYIIPPYNSEYISQRY